MASHAVGSMIWRPKNKRTRKKTTKAFLRECNASRLYNLMLDVNELKQELYDLKARKHALQTRSLYTHVDHQGVALKTVHQYFQLLYRGFHQCPTTSAFITSIAAPQLTLGSTTLGLDMLFEQWRRYTKIFLPRSYALVSAEVIQIIDLTSIVRCSVVLRGVFTHEALATVFPLTLWEPIVWNRLIGRELVCPMLFHMHFNADGKLVRHDVEANFFAAVDRVLQDSRVTARIVESAIVAEESMLSEVISFQYRPFPSFEPQVDEASMVIDGSESFHDDPSPRLDISFLLS